MSIHDKRLKAQIDEIIKCNLSKGYIPTSNEVVSELSKYVASNNLDTPNFKFSKSIKNFTAAELDKAKGLTSDDLDIIYSSLVELYQLSEEQVDKFEVEKKKYDYRIAKLESLLTGMVAKYSTNGYTANHKDSFSDMGNIDLSLTTADVDITNHEATIKRLSDILYTDFNVQVSSNGRLVQNGDINTFIADTGVVWQGIIQKDVQELTSTTLLIDTKVAGGINKIELEAPMLKTCAVEISTSLDGDKWNTEYSGVVLNRCVANFSTKLRYIKVVFSRTEADKFSLGKYLYYFIIDAIKLSAINYAMQSTLITKPINAGMNINKVVLVDNANVPPSTSIEYFIAMKSAAPEWLPISPVNARTRENPDVVSFNTIESDKRLPIKLPDGVSNEAYELKNLAANGQKLYAIAELDSIDITRYKLYKGIRSWKVDTLNQNLIGPQTHAVFIQNIKSITTSYSPIVLEKPSLILNGVTFTSNCVKRYSTTIYRNSSKTVVKAIPVSTNPVTIYCNGEIIFSGTPTTSVTLAYPLIKGLNTIDVILTVNNASPVSVDINLNILTLGSRVCADKEPLTPVSLFNLRYNTNNQYGVYALYKVDTKYIVVTKDPNLQIEYEFIYDYVVEEIKELLVKAVLKREHVGINVTPHLLSYEVRFI